MKVANKQYSSLNAEYEITFDMNSEIKPVHDDKAIEGAKFSFKKVRKGEKA